MHCYHHQRLLCLYWNYYFRCIIKMLPRPKPELFKDYNFRKLYSWILKVNILWTKAVDIEQDLRLFLHVNRICCIWKLADFFFFGLSYTYNFNWLFNWLNGANQSYSALLLWAVLSHGNFPSKDTSCSSVSLYLIPLLSVFPTSFKIKDPDSMQEKPDELH